MTLIAEHFVLSVAHDDNATRGASNFQPMGGLQIKSLQLQASPLERLDFSSRWRHLAGQAGGVRMMAGLSKIRMKYGRIPLSA